MRATGTIVCPRCGERLPEGFERCDACGAYLVPTPSTGPPPQRGPRSTKRFGTGSRRLPSAAWGYLVAGLVIGGAVGYALHSAVGPREEGGAPTGPSDVMSGSGSGMGAAPGGASGGQMPAEITAAVQRYRQILARDPDNLEANVGFGNLLFDSGQYDRAVEHYTRVLAKDPGNPDIRVDRAIAYHNLGQDDLAKSEILKATREHPEHRNAWLNLGVVSASTGDKATAIRAWEQYLKLEPNGSHSAAIREELEALKRGS